MLLYVVSYAADWQRLSVATFIAVLINLTTILILSRFGGDLGGTD